MCSELTPRAPIPDTRIPQLMQPCRWVIPDRKHQLILPCVGGYHTVVPDCRQGGRKNQVDWFLPDCGPEQWSISADVQHIVGGRSCTCASASAHPLPLQSLNQSDDLDGQVAHFTYWWVPFLATGPSRRPWPSVTSSLWGNLTKDMYIMLIVKERMLSLCNCGRGTKLVCFVCTSLVATCLVCLACRYVFCCPELCFVAMSG